MRCGFDEVLHTSTLLNGLPTMFPIHNVMFVLFSDNPPFSPTRPQALLCNHPPHEILSALEEVAHEGAMELNRHTSAIDLQQDALQLK